MGEIRCIGDCCRLLPHTSDFFSYRVRYDRAMAKTDPTLRRKCKSCTNADDRDRRASDEEDTAPKTHEMTFEDIGKKLGLSRQSVKQIYDRAIDKVRKKLIRDGLTLDALLFGDVKEKK